MKAIRVNITEPKETRIHFSHLQRGDVFRFTNADYQNLFMRVDGKQYVGLTGAPRGILYNHGTEDQQVDKITDIEISGSVVR